LYGADCARDLRNGRSTERGEVFIGATAIAELNAADVASVVITVLVRKQQCEGIQREAAIDTAQAGSLLTDFYAVNELDQHWKRARAGEVEGKRDPMPRVRRDDTLVYAADAYTAVRSVLEENITVVIVTGGSLEERAPRGVRTGRI